MQGRPSRSLDIEPEPTGFERFIKGTTCAGNKGPAQTIAQDSLLRALLRLGAIERVEAVRAHECPGACNGAADGARPRPRLREEEDRERGERSPGRQRRDMAPSLVSL